MEASRLDGGKKIRNFAPSNAAGLVSRLFSTFMSRKIISALICLLLLTPDILSGAGKAPRAATKGDDEFVVVIDPGHGGKDFGAIGEITNEKTINLAVSKIVRDIINDEAPKIKIVMTRSTDVFVTLNGRPEIAHKAGGDLFVSIHTNSVAKSNPNRKSVAGASVYTVGVGKSEENLAVAMRENAVMTLEPDYTTAYEGFDPKSAESYIIFEMDRDLHLEQSIKAAREVQSQLTTTAGRRNRGIMQAGFLVLRYTSMPSILVELDFICNPAQERYMASAEGQRAMGEAIADGIMNYCDAAMRARAHISATTAKTKTVRSGQRSPKRISSASARAATQRKAEETELKPEESEGKTGEPKPETGSEATDASDRPARRPAASVTYPAAPTELSESSDSIFYRIQFLTASTKLKAGDKNLRDLPVSPVNYYIHGGLVKYTLGRFTTENEAMEALKAVRRRFTDAFVITTRGNSRL